LIEFKRPGTTLDHHVSQLADYVGELLPQYGVLTNGNDLWLYRREDQQLQELPQKLQLVGISSQQTSHIFELLHKREVDLSRMSAVTQALNERREDSIRVSGPDDAGGRQFIQNFSLQKNVAFGRLVHALFEALPRLIERSDFANGAFEFWKQAYSRELELDETPISWRSFLPENAKKETLQHFMFALETAYVLLARVMLAKAMQDANFPNLDATKAFERSLETNQRRGTLHPIDYLAATSAVFKEGSKQAFENLFASDLFDWWTDAEKLEESRTLCEALAEAVLSVFQFDFAGLSGDLLGTLYQSYFDPETRKALGEFYTPPEVVEFILDHAGYEGVTVRTARLLDPACGSGTFLVHALQRYLKANATRDPATVLEELIWGLRITGFDINPFACLMAQVNYAAQILHLYAKALTRNPEFAIPLLPIFRTDSLRQEAKEGEAETVEERAMTKGFTLELKGDIAYIKTELPVRARETTKKTKTKKAASPFLEIRIPVPRFDRALKQQLVANVEEYFRVLHATFTGVKAGHVALEELTREFKKLKFSQPEKAAAYVAPAAEKVQETMEQLRTEYNDGRFLKTIEDLALAMVLKNDLQYDFVVGNPPYVRIQSIPEFSRRYWQGLYEWAEGNFDIFIPFIERAVVYWLKENGRLGFICSDRFLLANYAAKLREWLPQLAEMELLIDFRVSTVFQDAQNSPAILVMKKTENPKPTNFAAARLISKMPEEQLRALLPEISREIQEMMHTNSSRVTAHFDVFVEKQEDLTLEGWYLMPSEERGVFQKLNEAATHRLQELTLTQSGGFQGLRTGCDDVLVFKLLEERKKLLLVKAKGGGEPFEIEREIVRPLVFGEDIERWQLNWKSWLVFFPYFQIDGTFELIPSKTYKEKFCSKVLEKLDCIESRYSKAWKYLTEWEVPRKIGNKLETKLVETWLRAREHGRFQQGKKEKLKSICGIALVDPSA